MNIPDATLKRNELADYLNTHFPNYTGIWNSVTIDTFEKDNSVLFQRIKLTADHQFERRISSISTHTERSSIDCTSEEYSIYDREFQDGNIWDFLLSKLASIDGEFIFYGNISVHDDGLAYAVNSKSLWPSYLIVQRSDSNPFKQYDPESLDAVFEKYGVASKVISKENIASVIELELPFFRVADNRVIDNDDGESIFLAIEANRNNFNNKWENDKRIVISSKSEKNEDPVVEHFKLLPKAGFQQITSSKRNKIVWSKIEIFLKDLCVYSSEAFYLRSFSLNAVVKIADR